VGDHLAQVLLQHHAIAKQRCCIHSSEDLVERVEAVDNFLTATGTGVNRLEANGAAVQQVLGGGPRVLQGKHGQAIEHHVAHTLAELRRPALRRVGQMAAQAVTDGFGADEIVFDESAP